MDCHKLKRNNYLNNNNQKDGRYNNNSNKIYNISTQHNYNNNKSIITSTMTIDYFSK